MITTWTERHLAGHWSLRRRILHADGTVWTLTGVARFCPLDDGLRQIEEGTLTGPGGARIHATRTQLWRYADTTVEIAFADGRPFHRLALGAAMARVRHFCPPDAYTGRFTAQGADLWWSFWRVVGPRKDYRMQTRYTRSGAP
ncbi:MAG: DUF6314 family protein [Pseudomonadota bacterium]